MNKAGEGYGQVFVVVDNSPAPIKITAKLGEVIFEGTISGPLSEVQRATRALEHAWLNLAEYSAAIHVSQGAVIEITARSPAPPWTGKDYGPESI